MMNITLSTNHYEKKIYFYLPPKQHLPRSKSFTKMEQKNILKLIFFSSIKCVAYSNSWSTDQNFFFVLVNIYITLTKMHNKNAKNDKFFFIFFNFNKTIEIYVHSIPI